VLLRNIAQLCHIDACLISFQLKFSLVLFEKEKKIASKSYIGYHVRN
jgi:hypothetical protein